MSNMKVYFDLSDELEMLLSDNKLSISSILQLKNVDCDVNYGEMPLLSQQTVQNRDLLPFFTSVEDALTALIAFWQTFKAIETFIHVKVEECCLTRTPPCKVIYECQEIDSSKFKTILKKDIGLDECVFIIRISIRSLKF